MEVALYLIPVTLGDTPIDKVLPDYNHDIIMGIKYFIVEEVRTARRFLKRVDKSINIDELTFYPMGKHADKHLFSTYLEPLRKGESVGVISEAGCPAIADPGADVVAVAQREGLKVVPLVGPSSILLGLMASGFNGQGFAFNGYLPIDTSERIAKIKKLEQRAISEKQTQIFIETPYRNAQMIKDILQACHPTTHLCIASGITCDNENIITHTISEWKKKALPDLHKIPTVFLIYY